MEQYNTITSFEKNSYYEPEKKTGRGKGNANQLHITKRNNSETDFQNYFFYKTRFYIIKNHKMTNV